MFKSKALMRELEDCQNERNEAQLILRAIQSYVAAIEFSPTGEILEANSKFLSVVGYSSDEVIGSFHRLFCEPGLTESAEYKAFWQQLRQGVAQTGTFLRLNKQRQPLWLEATYFPVLNEHGTVVKIVKIASDITQKQQRLNSQEAILSALQKSMAVIEFKIDGTIISANDNFLNVMGYRLEQLTGQSHKIFCDADFYQQNPSFWSELVAGQHKAGRFRRIDALGREIWLEATYNPILDEAGKVVRVVKFASDITERVRQSERNMAISEEVGVIASETSTIVEKGNHSLQASVHTSTQVSTDLEQASAIINQLNEQAHNIEEIVATISGLADQTNLLALNAAIEAARAGEQGRGFAVVAEEVRSLALRSATAAKEINGLINSSVATVSQGSVLVHETGVTITEIISSVERVTRIIAEISTASDEQHQGIEQVNQAIIQMDDVTQQNAALVEESAAAAESLQEQSENLSGVVAVFSVETVK